MFEDIGRDDEVVRSEPGRFGSRDVEKWFLVEEGVGVIQLAAQPGGIDLGIAEADAGDVRSRGEVGDGETFAEELHRERMDDTAEAHGRSAVVTTVAFTCEGLDRVFRGMSADVAGESEDVASVCFRADRLDEEKPLYASQTSPEASNRIHELYCLASAAEAGSRVVELSHGRWRARWLRGCEGVASVSVAGIRRVEW